MEFEVKVLEIPTLRAFLRVARDVNKTDAKNGNRFPGVHVNVTGTLMTLRVLSGAVVATAHVRVDHPSGHCVAVNAFMSPESVRKMARVTGKTPRVLKFEVEAGDDPQDVSVFHRLDTVESALVDVSALCGAMRVAKGARDEFVEIESMGRTLDITSNAFECSIELDREGGPFSMLVNPRFLLTVEKALGELAHVEFIGVGASTCLNLKSSTSDFLVTIAGALDRSYRATVDKAA